MSSRPSRGAARLAAILDALPDALLLVNTNGTVVNANTIALEAFETSGWALVGRGLLDLLPEFDSRLIPGSMRRPDATDDLGRTRPRRMMARRTDGSEFPVEVTSANLDDARDAYESHGFGDELLMLVVRDLSGTMDTEAELARSQRQTEMILRAAAEGVVGTDTEGRVVLVNPAAAQILGYRASDLGGQELHPLVQHSRADGTPFPYDESALSDTLRSGRKHRVRGQVLWTKSGAPVPVDLTTAPVRDGEQLVGAVLAFTDRRAYDEVVTQQAEEAARHAKEIAAAEERYAALAEREKERHAALAEREKDRYEALAERESERYEALSARHAQLLAVLGESLRGPLDELRRELGTLAADPAGQLWPEANQVLHHLTAGYARMSTLVDNVLAYQRLDTGAEELHREPALSDGVIAAGIEGAVELIGPGRAQFAVHAPPIEAEVDAARLATALAHLVADVAGIDSTGQARVPAGAAAGGGATGGYVDSTIVVAAAQRGDVVRIEVRGPYAGGDPVHGPIVRGIVRAHGGVLQTHDVPGMGGNAYVLEVPIGAGAGAAAVVAPVVDSASAPSGDGTSGSAEVAVPEQQRTEGGGRRARRASVDAFLTSGEAESGAAGSGSGADAGPAVGADVAATGSGAGSGEAPTGRRRRRAAPAPEPRSESPSDSGGAQAEWLPAQNVGEADGSGSGGTGRRRRRALAQEAAGEPAQGSVVTAAEHAAGAVDSPGLGDTVPPQGMPTGRRARRNADGAQTALPAGSPVPDQPRALEAPAAPVPSVPDPRSATSGARHPVAANAEVPGARAVPDGQPSGGRRARRALGTATAERNPEQVTEPAGSRSAFALPPAAADRTDTATPSTPSTPSTPTTPTAPATAAGPVEGHPHEAIDPTHATRHDAAPHDPAADHTPPGPHPVPTPTGRRRAAAPTQPAPSAPAPEADSAPAAPAAAPTWPTPSAGTPAAGTPTTASIGAQQRLAQPPPAGAPAEAPAEDASDSTLGRSISVRTLGQGVPFAQQATDQQRTNTNTGSGRRRKLGTPPDTTHPEAPAPALDPEPAQPKPADTPLPQPQPEPRPEPDAQPPRPAGRAYAIGAPDEGAEGPEPLDGPNGAVEVANRPQPQPMDDELPPEPLDNPRRLLVWPAPDVSTQQALCDRGYRPVTVNSRDEVDAQIAAFPAALFVDPLTGPITRTALQSLRTAAVAAEVPVLVTAGLGQATREAAYGADPAVLLKALAPRDSEQHPPRVLLIEEHEEIAQALTATLERRGMQVARANADTDAVTLATQMRPNLVVMDLMQVRRRRAGIVDWLRANGQLNRTPLVVYTAAVDQAELPKLASGETVLFLAERSTSAEVQGRIVDLLAKIGTN